MASDNTASQGTSTKDAPTTMAPAQSWEPSKKLSPRKRRRRMRLLAVALVVAAYVAGTWHFSSHFTPGTTVDGLSCGGMTTDELADALASRASSYEQHITDANGFDATITAEEMGLGFDARTVAEEARERLSPALWLPYVLSPRHMLIDGNIQVDDERLAARVGELVDAYNKDATPPTEATTHYDEAEDAFVIDPDALGTQLDATAVAEQIVDGARGLRDEVVLSDKALARPRYTASDETLLATCEAANALLDVPLVVVSDGKELASPDRATRAGWVTIEDDRSYSLHGAINWVNATDAIVKAGNAIDEEHVWELDDFGTAVAIFDALKAGGGKVEVVRNALVTKPAVTPGAKERGRHIDVNITTQFCRLYDTDGTVIWDSYCVTGGYDSQYGDMHATPTGTYAIESKQTSVTLVGADRDGDKKPDYESFVYYWMPFLNNDYGFHDATWRSEDGFGGDTRFWWGSHGCINLPYSKAEELFGLIVVGDTVYIHE